MLRPFVGPVAIAVCAVAGACLGTLFHAPSVPAQGAPVDAPTGTVVYTTAASCPPGWNDAPSVAGRLVVGTDVAGNVGATVGTPMPADQAPTHRHSVSFDVTFGEKGIVAASGTAAAGRRGTYNSSGDTTSSHSGVPLHHLRACRKP